MNIEMFSIRHKSTGNYLHASCRGRGMTQNEPYPIEGKILPRMFPTEKSASKALQCWCRGRYNINYGDEGSFWTGKITPVPTRVFEDMEIVTITIEIP